MTIADFRLAILDWGTVHVFEIPVSRKVRKDECAKAAESLFISLHFHGLSTIDYGLTVDSGPSTVDFSF